MPRKTIALSVQFGTIVLSSTEILFDLVRQVYVNQPFTPLKDLKGSWNLFKSTNCARRVPLNMCDVTHYCALSFVQYT